MQPKIIVSIRLSNTVNPMAIVQFVKMLEILEVSQSCCILCANILGLYEPICQNNIGVPSRKITLYNIHTDCRLFTIILTDVYSDTYVQHRLWVWEGIVHFIQGVLVLYMGSQYGYPVIILMIGLCTGGCVSIFLQLYLFFTQCTKC